MKTKVICLFLFITFSLHAFSQNEPIGIASPIQLKNGENKIDLEDYFIVSTVRSVKSDIGLPFGLSQNNKILQIHIDKPISQSLSVLHVETNNGSYDLLVKSPKKKKVRIKLRDQGYSVVEIKGEMNNWNPSKLALDNEGYWFSEIMLNPGKYQYKFIVDDKETNDPVNQDSISNGTGGYNSVLNIEGGDPNQIPHISTKKEDSNSITLSSSITPSNIYCFLGNEQINAKVDKDEISISIPSSAHLEETSLIRCYAEAEGGMSNDLLIPLRKGKVVQHGEELTRHDYRSQIMYFTLIDRFNNGNKSIDDPIVDERLKPLTNYMGGDLDGIAQKIKQGYFDSLNINSIWLSPITQNPQIAYQEYIEPQYFYSGYHGYWPISSSKVDHRFGDDNSLKNLVDLAHEHEINILLDYVTNHVHEEHPLFKEHPEYGTDLILEDSSYNLRIWDEQRLTTWFDLFLPSLDFSNPDVIHMQVDSTIYWLKKFGLDGYRHDATKHIPTEFWIELTKQLKKEVCLTEGRSIYQIGETYGSRDLISSYISSGMLDCLLYTSPSPRDLSTSRMPSSA